MSRPEIRHASFLLLLTLGAACGYDSATYPPAPSVQDGLWTSASVSPTVMRLAPNQLLTTGDIAPATAVYTSAAELINLNGLAFDTDGTLWVTSDDDSMLVAFPPGALARSGAVETRVIAPRAGSLSRPTALAFDGQHRLWVANTANGTIVRYDRAQLAASGAPAPAVIISRVGTPSSLAFDAAGSLWVSDIRAGTISSFSPAKLAESGSPAPDVRLTSGDDSLANLAGIAFDAAGNLWVANPSRRTVAAYSVSQLGASGSPTPHIVLSPADASSGSPAGLAFDADGSLWVIGVDGVLVKYNRSSLTASGTPAPSVRLALTDYVLFWNVAFWPKPAGLPLH